MGDVRIATVTAVVALALLAVGAMGVVGGVGTGAAAASVGGVQTTTNGTATGSVAGTVTDESGAAVANATVTVGTASTTTNATGGYALSVPTGTDQLTVSVAGQRVANRSVNVTENETTVVDVTVAVTATVEGTVTDAGGDPISSVSVDLRQPGGFEDTAGFPDEYVARTQPGADGGYALAVEPGEYDLGAGSLSYELTVTSVSLAPGETVTRNLTLERADGGITGTVTDEQGTPVENATVATLDGTASVTTGADGTFDQTLPEGTYSVLIDADGYRPENRTVDVLAGRTTAFDVALTSRNGSQSPLGVEIVGTSGPVAPGETLTVDANLTNGGNESISRTVTLTVDGSTADDTFVSVPGGGDRAVTLLWTANSDASGSYTAIVQAGEATASTVLTVDPSLNGTDDGSTGTDDGSTGTDDGDSGDGGLSFGPDDDSDSGSLEGIGGDGGSFDGFDTNGSDSPAFEFENETGGSDFGFETGTDEPVFEFGIESTTAGFDFGGETDEPLFEFGTGEERTDFGFGGDADAPTFDFSTD